MRKDIEKLVQTAFAWEDREIQEIVIKYLSPCIAGSFTKTNKVTIGKSKLGGMPDLPMHMQYPVREGIYCEFFGQLNFQELKPFDEQNLLPAQGLLSIFCQFYQDKKSGEALEEIPKNSSQFFGLYFKNLSNFERKTVPLVLQNTLLAEYALEYGPYYNTIHSSDPRLGEVELELEMEFGLEDSINAYFGYKTRPDCVLLGNITENGVNVHNQWSLFQSDLEQPIENISILQMELPEELLVKRSKYGCSGHFNIGIPIHYLKQGNFSYLSCAYCTS